MTEYEYKYYSVFQKGPNTNTNIIQFSKKDRKQILFGSPKIYTIAEKSQTNANSVSMQSCMHTIQVNI